MSRYIEICEYSDVCIDVEYFALKYVSWYRYIIANKIIINAFVFICIVTSISSSTCFSNRNVLIKNVLLTRHMYYNITMYVFICEYFLLLVGFEYVY